MGDITNIECIRMEKMLDYCFMSSKAARVKKAGRAELVVVSELQLYQRRFPSVWQWLNTPNRL